MVANQSPSQTGKVEALERVLQSRTLQRSEQLRTFLKFVVTAELEGRGAELSEYRIGAEALGRGHDFSPQEDGVVRNRAHALRDKLDAYYREENPEDPVRIEIPKGTYRPVFRHPAELPAELPTIVESAPPRATRRRWPAIAIGVAIIVLAAAGWLVWQRNHTPAGGLAAGVREVFGPLLEKDGNVVVCLATPVHMVLRPVPTRVSPGSPAQDGSPWRDWYASRRSVPTAAGIYLRPSPTSLFWGDAVAALTVVRALALEGVQAEIQQEQNLSLPALRGRNVIFIGRPEYSEFVKAQAPATGFEVAFVPELQETGVVSQDGRERYLPEFNEKGELASAFGLVTVLPAKGPDLSPRRTIILSGTSSPGTQAVAEFVVSPRFLADFAARLRGEGYTKLPDAYQVVVKAKVQGTSILNTGYAGHRVLLPARGQ